MKIKEIWHRSHPMPPKATTEQRIQWRLEHAQSCACRPIPPKLLDEMRRQGLASLAPLR